MSPLPAPALNNVWVCRIDGLLNGIPCANVLAFRDTSNVLTAELVSIDIENNLTTVLGNPVGTAYQGTISTLRTWTNLHVVRYNALDPDVFDQPLAGAQWTGDLVGDLMPPQIAVCVTLRTGLASRRFRGRLYDYGFTEFSSDGDGRMDAGTRTNVGDFWDAFRVQIDAASALEWGILSRGWINEGAQDPRESYAQSFTPLISAIVRDLHFDTMRSRVT